MLVGAGGNAGNQSAVRIIRGLAVGAVNARTRAWYLLREAKMAAALSATLVLVGLARVVLFHGWSTEAAVISCALALIVIWAIVIGALLPLAFMHIGIDPVHAGTTIQVLMDILGVAITCIIASALLVDGEAAPATDGMPDAFTTTQSPT